LRAAAVAGAGSTEVVASAGDPDGLWRGVYCAFRVWRLGGLDDSGGNDCGQLYRDDYSFDYGGGGKSGSCDACADDYLVERVPGKLEHGKISLRKCGGGCTAVSGEAYTLPV
jgi:hypothetical protein